MSSESVNEFLNAFKAGTRRVYGAGLEAFLKFYRTTGRGEALDDFLDAVEEDLRRPRREKKRVARNILKEFVRWLHERDYSPKTIRAYVSAIQSYAHYNDISISTRYVDMPSSQPISQKYPWTLDKAVAFIEEIEYPEIKSVGATIFQSGLSVSDILALTWRDIRLEFREGITPLCLDLSRIKTDVPFMTFLGRWGESLLRTHLEGKKMRLEDPLYTVSQRMINLEFERLGKRWVGEYRGFNPCRPHSLRAAFRTLLADARMPADEIRFFMGHKLPEQERVYMSRSRDGWRKFYAQYEHALTPS